MVTPPLQQLVMGFYHENCYHDDYENDGDNSDGE